MQECFISHHCCKVLPPVNKMKISFVTLSILCFFTVFAVPKTVDENTRREAKLLLTMKKYPEVMAEFNGHKFTVKMVAKWVMEKHPDFEDYSYPELLDAIEQVLDEKIYYTIVADFLEKEGFPPSQQATEKYLRQSINRFPGELKKLKYRNNTVTSLAADPDRQLSVALQNYLKKKKPAEISVKNEDIEYFYRVNQNIFMHDAKLDIAFIAVAKKEKNSIRTITDAHSKLAQGMLFEKLANEINSRLPENFFGADGFPPEIAAKAAQMPLNEPSEVLEFPNYYAIIQLNQKQEPKYIPLKNAEFFIKTELESRKSGIYLEKLLNELLAKTKIKK